MWSGRFEQPTDALLRTFSESVSFDWRLYAHDIEGSLAHAAALHAAGLLTDAEREQIEGGLNGIRDEIARGEFHFRPELEDVHMNVEATLTERIGAAGAKLHTARSRNDQVALDLRLYLREEMDVLRGELRAMQLALVGLAERFPRRRAAGLHASATRAARVVRASPAGLRRDV